MNKIFTLILFFSISIYFTNAQTTVDCAVGPVNTVFCYDSGVNEEFIFVSSDGTPLNLTVNSGNVEGGFDEFIVLDSDGTELFNGFGNGGDLAGLTFQSTGDEITVQVTPDGSIDCQGSTTINPIDLTVSCATCVNPQIDFELVSDCLVAPQFFVEADVIDLGSATDLDITDNQGNPAQTVSTTGVISFGPYPNGTEVELTVENNQDVNCQIQSEVITQDNCTLNLVDCAVGPVNTVFCYDSGVDEEFSYVSSDGTPLNLTVNSGNVEGGFDEFIVLDSDGTELFNGFGNGGDLAGLTFQSTGDEITVQVTPDGSIDCQGSDTINPIDLTVSCATCVNPQVDFELVSDCLVAPQFFVEANVIDLGSATDLDITDNQGNPAQTVSTTGVISFGPYPNGTLVELIVENNQDVNCQLQSGVITQEVCTLNLVDCSVGPVNTVFCYDNNVIEEFTYVSNDGTNLNLVVNSGDVQNNFDEFIVLDTDGTELFNGYGNEGDLTGLTFQSTGDEITVQVTPNGFTSCQSSNDINPIDLTVSCATCVNPQVDFELVDNCLVAPEFFVEADVTDLGSATDLDITDNQGNPAQTVSTTGVVSFGPYPNGTLVELTVENNQDNNCQVQSGVITQDNCTLNLVDCAVGPVNTVFCYDSGVDEEFSYVSSDGSSLNLTVNSGNVENNFDEFIVLDSDGTELFNGFGNGGDLAGLTFQSTGDEITVQVTPDGSIDCQGSTTINPIDLTVSCATCTNPQVNFELVDNCLVAPEFFVEADVIDLGSATDLDITDNQGNPAQTVSTTGVISFGPYPNGTEVELTVENNQDINCQVQSGVFTQDNCTLNLVDCTVGPVNTVFCYDSGVDEEFSYVSSDGSPLNLIVNSGNVENNFDEFIVLDSDGTELYNGFGNGGDLAGLTFQSTGDEITVQVTPDGSIDCQGSTTINPIDLTVSCATCTNPDVEYFVVGNCGNGNEEFSVEVEILDLGSASALDITNNQGDPLQNITAPTTLTFGPYALGTDVVFTVENVDDVNCTLTSPSQTLVTCGCFGPDPFCAPGPGESLIFENVDDSSGTEANPELSNYGCLFTQPNPVWFYMQVEESGELVFEIIQNTEFDDQGNPVGTPLDVDFIAWGPFPDTQFCNDLDSCTECGSNTFDDNYPYGNVMDCSYSAAPTETFTIPNAQSGEIYAVLITNFNGDPGFISLGQSNIDDENSGSTNCDIVLQNQVTACESDGVTLTAADMAADQFQWLIFNEDTQEFDPIEGENEMSIFVTESGLYQILTLNGTEVSTEEFDVTLIPEPEHNLPDQIAICSNDSTILDATVTNPSIFDSIDYQWFLDGNPLAGETEATYEVSETGNYSVEITTTTLNTDTDGNDLTCVSLFDVVVTSADFTVDLGENETFCDIDSQTITAVVDGADDTNATYLWNTGEDTASIDVNTSGTYEVTVTIEGCPVTQSVTYTFAEQPIFDLGEDLNLCEGETIQLDATLSNADDFTSVAYQWFNSNGLIAGETQNTLEVTTQGNYSVEVTTTTTTADGQTFDCVTTDAITINGAVFSVDLGGDQTFCDAGTQTITATVNGADDANATYLWNTGETTSSIDVSVSNVYEVTVTIDGCPVTSSVDYTFNESPIIALGPDTATCDLQEIVLNATPSNAADQPVNYAWTLNGDPLNQTSAIINPTEFGTYEVEVYFNDISCSSTDSINLSVRDDISVNLASDDEDNLFCANEVVSITSELNNAIEAEAQYQWFENETAIPGATNSNLTNFELTFENGDEITIALEVVIGTACFVDSELTVNKYAIDNCVIPQGLSPDDDGLNDNLDLSFLADRTGIQNFEVFNRYGRKVYEKANYRDEFFGQSDNGNNLKTGTYFYVIKFNQEDETFGIIQKGWIYINREQ